MKAFFVISVVLLLAMVGVRFWLDRERASERVQFENASEIYQAREAELLKSRAKALEAITKIVPAHGAKGGTPGASPVAGSSTPTPDTVAAPPAAKPPE
jgi:hypothetical protein